MKRPIPSQTVGWGFLLAAIVIAVFANCRANGFVWDDEQFIQKNAYLTSPRYLPEILTSNIVEGAGLRSNLYRPLQSLTHWVDVRLWGMDPAGHHVTNVLFHIAASIAIFLALCRLFPPPAAFLSAAFFALHPLQSEAVAYVSGRGDLMAFFFLASALIAFEKRPRLGLALAAMGLFSKEHMVMFPVFLFLYEYARGRAIDLKRHAPFWILAAGYALLRLTVLNFNNTLNFYASENVFTENFHYRLFTYFTTAAKGLSLWFWPADLHHERSWPVYTSLFQPKVAASFFVVLSALVAAFAARKTRRPVSAGILWFFAATFPTSNLVVLINAIFYDHWFLLPGLGLAFVAGSMLVLSSNGTLRKAAYLVFAAALIPMALMTAKNNEVWRSPESLYNHILKYEPRSAKIHSNLGMVYSDQGKIDEAIAAYRRSIAISDEYPQTHHNLAMAYLTQGREDDAMEEFRKAVAMSPSFHHSWENLGILHLMRRNDDEAELAFAKALRAYPYSPKCYLGLAEIRLRLGDKKAALAVLDDGLSKMPSQPALLRMREDVVK